MPAPWEENPHKVVVEFLKTGSGATRLIKLKHSAAVVPPQLNGRMPPHVWQAFMADIEQAAQQHPYVVKPSAGRVGSWVACGALMSVVGFCCINPDGGDYNVWLPQIQSIIDRHHPAFAACGCQLSLQRAQQSYWVQIDINPNMAVGQPAAAAQYNAGPYTQAPPPPEGYPAQQTPYKPGFEPKPGYEGKPPY